MEHNHIKFYLFFLFGVLGVAFFSRGCGAKTGLLMPDAGPDAEPETQYCIEVDPEERRASLELDVSTRLLSADVFFLIDCTGSMRGEINNIQQGLSGTIVPGTMEQIPDIRFGVGAFGDFPIGEYGDSGDSPFQMRRAITDDIGAVQSAIDGLPYYNGDDLPESHVEALYQVATGEGFGSYVDPAPGCASVGLGYPCFREGSQPVVVLVTDAPFHNGPDGAEPYGSDVSPSPHTFDQAVDALRSLGIRVIGISSSFESQEDLEELARRTGAVDGDGIPLVHSISASGRGLDQEVVRGIESLARRVPLDVDAISLDVVGDDVDATIFIDRLIALRAEPPEGVSSIEDATFYQAMPGTRLVFRVDFYVNVDPPPPTTQLYPVMIRIRGNRVSVLREEIIYIQVPGEDGVNMCAELENQ